MLFRLQREGIHVDTDGRDVGVVLVRLDPVEVVAVADGKPIVAVELDQGSDHRVVTSHAFNTGDGVTAFQNGAVPIVRVVERLLSLPRVDDSIIAADEGVALDNPDELLARVVEVELDLVGRGGDGFATSELEGIDQILVSDLGELTTFIRVQVDVVNIQGRSDQALVGNTVTDDVGVAGALGGKVPAHVAEVVEFQVDTDFVVLESNERQGQTGVSVEPELERDVEGVFRGALLDFIRGVGDSSTAVSVAGFTTLDEGVDELRNVTNHLGITSLLSRFLGEFVPDVEPVTIVLVDTLTTNFDFDVLDDVVTRPVQPSELSTRAVTGLESDLREGSLEIHAVDQITITLDGASDLLAKVGGTIERVFNGFHGKVGVTTVNNLKDIVYPSFRRIFILALYPSNKEIIVWDWTIT